MSAGRLLVFAGLLVVPSLSSAQAAAPAGAEAAEHVAAVGAALVEARDETPAGPRLDAERLGMSRAAADAEPAAPAPAAPRMGQSVALMAVGGAALVAGLIIGGDAGTVLALGGAVIGLVGLYQYLR